MRLPWGMRMRIVDFQPSEQEMKLLFSDMNSACFCGLCPSKVAFFQSTVIKPKAIEIPKQNVYFISIAIIKNEPGLTERIPLGDIKQSKIAHQWTFVCR